MNWRKHEGETALGIDWMTRSELAEAVPPVYAEFIGKEAMQIIGGIGNDKASAG
jgi:DNA (cytosine-5)-methyltransferase 1